MSHEKRIALLKDLDSAVWVEKRLFPARLLVLDKLEGNHQSEDLIKKHMQALWSDEDESIFYLTRKAGKGTYDLKKNLDELMIVASQKPIEISSRTWFEQFCSDLLTFGLREALAYMFENDDLEIHEQVRTITILEYKKIGEAFLRHSKEIQRILEKIYQQFLNGYGNISALLDRLIVADAIKLSNPWGDGFAQENHAV